MSTENQSGNANESTENQENTTPEFTVKVAEDSDNGSQFNWKTEEESQEQEEKSSEQTTENNESLNENSQQNSNSTEEEEEEEYETIDLTEEEAFKFLKEARGLDVETLEDLIKPKEGKKLSPEIEKFLEFQETTGNTNYNDFLETQKDWSKESQDYVLKQALKIENPLLTNEEVDFLFEKKYGFDEELDDDKTIKSKQIDAKVDYQKALNSLEQRKEQFKVNRGSDDNVPEVYKQAKEFADKYISDSQENEKFVEERRNDFLAKTDSVFSKNFEGFKTVIDGKEYPIKPTDISKTRESQIDIGNLQRQFFDENDNLTDPVGYHKALYFAQNADKVAEHYFNLGKAFQAEQDELESKNIPSREAQNRSADGSKSGFKVRVVD